MDGNGRQRVLFDADWSFFKGNVAGAEAVAFDDTGWRRLDVPHDWSIEGSFSEDAPSGGRGGSLPGGVGWYRKRFNLPNQDRGRKATIQFDGVYKHCDVWLNGHHLGFHPYGYTSFTYDLTPHLRFGEQENVLAVRVDNAQQPDARWYSGHLPARVADGHRRATRRPLGDLCAHAAGVGRVGPRRGADAGL